MSAVNDMVVGGATAQTSGGAVNLSLVKITTLTQTLLGVAVTSLVVVATVVTVVLIATRAGLVAPIANPDLAINYKAVQVDVYPLLNDENPRGDNLTIVSITQPMHGKAELIDGNRVIYTSDKYWSGIDYINYTCINDKLTATSYITLDIRNHVPEPIEQSHIVSKNTRDHEIDLFGYKNSADRSISDADDDIMALYNVTSPANGIIRIDGKKLYYTPNWGFNAQERFQYCVTDFNDTACEYINLIVQNDPPVAKQDYYKIKKNTIVFFDVRANDYDINFDNITITSVGNPVQGSANVWAEGTSVRYIPLMSTQTYSDSFEYTIFDGSAFDYSNVIVDVENTPPTAADVQVTVHKNTNATLIALPYADIDALDVLTVALDQTPTKGSRSLVVQSYAIQAQVNDEFYPKQVNNYTLSYTPKYGVDGVYTESIKYTVTDTIGVATGTVTINVINDAPVAVEDVIECKKNLNVIADIVANDYDINGDQIKLINSGVDINTDGGGKYVVLDDNRIQYTPKQGFLGLDNATYILTDVQTDSTKNLIATGILRFNVVNTPPVPLDDAFRVPKGFTQCLTVLANDTDPNNDVVSLNNAGSPSSKTDAVISTENNVQCINYTALNRVYTESWLYTVQDVDAATAQARVTVDSYNIPPEAVNDAISTSWNQSIIIAVLSNDRDANPGDKDLLTVAIPLPRTTTDFGGSLEIISGKAIKYTPPVGKIGVDTFTYFAFDQIDNSATPATVTVTVVDNAPVANPFQVTIHWGTSAPVNLLGIAGNADPDNDPIYVSTVSTATNGVVTLNNGIATYKPNGYFVGTDSFTYTLSDWLLSTTNTVTVTVANTPPVANPVNIKVHWNSPKTVAYVQNLNNDPDNDPFHISNLNIPTSFKGLLNTTADKNNVEYTPIAWKGVQQARYTITDGPATAESTITVNVTNNDVPAPQPLSYRRHWTSQVLGTTITVLKQGQTDTDGDVLSFSATQGAHGSVNTDATTMTYKQTAGYLGLDQFTYTINDGLDSTTAAVNFDIFDTAPTASNYAVSRHWALISSGISLDTVALCNAADADTTFGDVASLSSFTVAGTSIGATIRNGNILNFTPTKGQVATQTYNVRFTDGLLFADAQVAVTVQNTVPVATPQPKTVHWSTQNTGTLFDILAEIKDADNDTVVYKSVQNVRNGNAVINSGKILFTQTPNYLGSASFDVTFTDGWQEATATWNVNVVDRAPVAVNQQVSVKWTTYVDGTEIDVLAGATDQDTQDTVKLASTTFAPTRGTAVLKNGKVLYKPNQGYTGTDSFTFTVTDGLLNDTKTVAITVTDTAPVAVDDTASVHWNTRSVTFNLIPNDIDADGDAMSIKSITAPPQAPSSLTVNTAAAPGTVTFALPTTGNAFALGNYNAKYRITDGALDSNEANIVVTVTNNNMLTAADVARTIHWRTANTGVEISVYNSTTDADQDFITLTKAATPANSFATVVNKGATVPSVFRYVRTPASKGSDFFRFTLSDGMASSTAQVNLNIYNNAPTANDINNVFIPWYFFSTGMSIDVKTMGRVRDADVEDQTFIKISAITQPKFAGSRTEINATAQTVMIYPANSFTGLDWFTYTITDGLETVTKNVTVSAANNLPNPDTQFFSIHWKTYLTGTEFKLLETYGTYGISYRLTTVLQAPESNAAAIVYPDVRVNNTLKYTQSNTFIGTDTVKVEVKDNLERDSTITAVVEVYDNAPTTTDKTANIHWSRTANTNVFADSTDPDGSKDTLQVTTVGNPSNGATAFATGSQTNVIYTPSNGFVGTDSYTFVVSDGLLSATRTVTITVTNTPPVPVAKNYEFHWKAFTNGVSVDILNGDTDADTTQYGDVISLVSVTQPDDASAGTTKVNGNKVDLKGPSATPYYGKSFRFTYTETDGAQNGQVSQTATVLVTDQAPVAVADNMTIHWRDTNKAINVLNNDFDPDTQDTIYVTSTVTSSVGATVSVATQNTVIYTPKASFTGTDIVTYQLTDGAMFASPAGRLTVTVYNTAPVAKSYTLSKHWVDAKANGFVFPVVADATDDDTNDATRLQVTGTPSSSQGTVTVTSGQIKFVPNNGFTGTTTFTYTITDGLATATGTIQVTVTDGAPTATPFNTNVHWRTQTTGTQIDITTSLNDPNNDPIVVSSVNSPTANGIASLTGKVVTYKQNTNFIGSDSFTVAFSDTWMPSTTATYTVSVFNTAPVAQPLTSRIHSSTYAAGATIDVTNNAVVANRPTDADSQDATFLRVSTVSGAYTGTASVTNSGQSLKYVPIRNQLGDSVITYTVTDGLSTGSNTWTVTVYNNAPTNQDYQQSVHWATCANSGVQITVSTNAADPDSEDTGKLTFTPSSTPAFGTVTVNGGVFTYVCKPGTGRVTDSFQFTTSDGTLSTVNTVRVTVTNGVPVTVADSYNRHWKDSVFVADVKSNDSDPNNDPTTIVASSLSSPTSAGATISVSGNGISYNLPTGSITPNKLNVADEFFYRITDSVDQSAVAKVSVTLYDNPPSAQAYSKTMLWSGSDTTTLVCTDPDTGKDTATFAGVTQPAAGTITVLNAATGQIRFNPPSAAPSTGTYTQTYTATYTCTDGLLTSSATLTYTVSNTQPISSSKTATLPHNFNQPTQPFTGLINAATDADNDVIKVSNLQLTPASASGTSVAWSVDSSSFTVTTPRNFVGDKIITWQVFDGQLYSPTYNYVITYTNDPPVCVDIPRTITKNQQAVFNTIASSCTDSNNDPLTFTTPTTAAVPFGSISTTTGPVVTYTPAARRSGSFFVEYTANDNAGGTDTAKLTVTVNNQAPVARNAAYTFTGSYADNAVYTISTYIADSGSNDPDNGDSVTVQSASGGTCNNAQGSASASNGVIRFTNFAASRYGFSCTVQVTIVDNDQDKPLTSTATVTITINAPSPPVANDDTYLVPQTTTTFQIPTGTNSITTAGRTYDGLMLNDVAPQGTSIVFDSLLPCTTGYCRRTPTLNSAQTIVNYPVDQTSCVQDRFQYKIRTSTSNPLYATATVTIKFTNCYCRSALDIYFVVDSSGSIGTENFKTQRQFLVNLTGNFDISTNGINVGVVQFGSNGFVYQSLSSSASATRTTLSGLPYLAGSTHTLAGLNSAIADITGTFPNNGSTRVARGRPNVPKVLVVVTDGCSNVPCHCTSSSSVQSCSSFYGTGSSVARPPQCSSPNYPNMDCSNCNYDTFWSQYKANSPMQSGCMPCADPIKLTDQINSWNIDPDTGLSDSPYPNFPVWKVIAMGVGDLINNTFGRQQISGMNYDHDPNNMIMVSWSNLQNAVNTIVDAACNT